MKKLTWLLLLHDSQKQRDILRTYMDVFTFNGVPAEGNVLIPHPSKDIPASVIASLIRGGFATLVHVETYSNAGLCEKLLWDVDPYEGLTPFDMKRLEGKVLNMAEEGRLRYCRYKNDSLWLVVKEEE